MKGTKVGDIVMWCKSPYTVIKIVDDKALLKQNFSIGTTLTETVDLDELSLLDQNKENE
jgi:hypothetical protein